MAIELIEEAVAGGARRIKACEILKISLRTLQSLRKFYRQRRSKTWPDWRAEKCIK